MTTELTPPATPTPEVQAPTPTPPVGNAPGDVAMSSAPGWSGLPILVIVLTVICATAALALVGVNEATKERIAEQKRMVILRSIRAVMPPCENEPDRDVTVLNMTGEGIRNLPTAFYRGMQNGKYHAVAFEVTSPEGYGGDITIMVGVLRNGVLNGIEVVEHKETPGLGALVAEAKYQSQFDGRGRTLDNTVWAVTKDGGELDALAGATITPRAIIKSIREGLIFFRDHQDAIFGEPQCEGEAGASMDIGPCAVETNAGDADAAGKDAQ